MPPKGSGKLREEGKAKKSGSKALRLRTPVDFLYNEDRSKVKCKACAMGWIVAKSAAKHLTTPEHLKAVKAAEEANLRKLALAKERLEDSAIQAYRTASFTPQHPSGPTASGSSTAVRNETEIEMWADYEMNGARFDAGEEPEDQRARWEQLGREADSFGLWDPGAAARRLGFGDENLDIAEDEEEDFLAEIMRKAGLDAPEPEEIQDDGENGKSSESDSQWFPYPSRMLFLPDTLDNLARLQISSSLMRVFLWILKEAHCKDVPSFDRLRQDWSNPTTRKLIHVYPEIPEDGIQSTLS
ncbi:hypothetical protein C8J57DRAFT_1245918 [Mycena rebaudengoi]|nr:hypothetical protein C8J57DRAFT_1245918 [Mycena rebaudengoi]